MRVSISLGLTLFTTTLFLACDSPSGPGSGGIPETAAPAPATKGYDITAVPRSRIARPPQHGLRQWTGIAPAMKKAKPRGKPSPLANGSFELNGGEATNLLDGWTVVDIGLDGGPTPGSWLVQTGNAAPITGFLVPSPTDGEFAAMADQFGPGAHILYQDVAVPRGRPILRFDLYLGNQAGEYFSPETLSPDEFPNQQFRVDIMDPSAPVDDVGSGVLRNVYRTQPGDRPFAPYQTIQVSLKEFAGRTVRLRFAEVDNLAFFEVGIDRVVIGKKAHKLKHAGRATAEAIPFDPETGTLANSILLGDDETTGPLPIGFEFAFFGNRYTTVNVSSNGFIGFDTDMSQGCCIGGLLPSDDGVNNIIALAWTDLYPPGGGQISYETRGSAPNRRLIISYTAVPWCCEVGVDRVTSQVILYERRSLIEIHTTHQDAEHIYTQGVENADGTVAAFLSGRMAADYGLVNDAVRFATK